ncbi:F1/F0 ATPase, subunit 2 [Maribacter orientalis]|uniref:F1/F0 ATPase, subunit 2 n=1 Tax=Maribacter orientalis TaxID=228957 RepID=A0A1H7FA32_9FLAO|nr:ATP synthase subunit I [Maribacter orientalis]SEK22919.1 F1/F0 ATPase, subunit 2 [Maribacter orientalis]
MNDYLFSVLVFIVGLALGTLFFGGLWLTVRKALTSKKPTLWFLGSLFLRVGITMLGFYYVAMGDWINMLICLLGFVIARFMVLNFAKTKDKKEVELKKES